MTIRVLLADDQALLRATFRLLLDSTPDLVVVAEAADGDQAVQLAAVERPDIVLMDIRMPHRDGIDATRVITTNPELSGTRIIILTTFETEELVIDALRAGASGYLGKDVEPTRLLDAVRTVAGGESLLSAAATSAVIARALTDPAVPRTTANAALDELTPREQEILVLVATGLSNTEIAQQLHLAPVTVKTHVNRAMIKLHAHDRAQLVIIAYEAGLLTPGQPTVARARP